MRATSKLRELLGTGKTLFVPGCYNALSAKILETVGFPAVYMTGYGTSVSLLGLPDAGLATMTEMHLNARYIANAVSVPVIADSDNGYGNAIGVIRTVREYIQTGVAGIHLEDQAVTESMGTIYNRTREHLGTSDTMVIKVRQCLLNAAKALRDYGTVPPTVDHPELYEQRSGGAILPRDVDWVETTREARTAALLPPRQAPDPRPRLG